MAPSKPAPARPPAAEAPVSRIERKERTRQRLIDSALTLVGSGRSDSSLSLREITREAGVVPAAFYRHLRDLDELGLALVEMAGAALRRLLREHRLQLLEALAETISDILLVEFGARWVRVKVVKPRKFDDVQAVGVQIERVASPVSRTAPSATQTIVP